MRLVTFTRRGRLVSVNPDAVAAVVDDGGLSGSATIHLVGGAELRVDDEVEEAIRRLSGDEPPSVKRRIEALEAVAHPPAALPILEHEEKLREFEARIEALGG